MKIITVNLPESYIKAIENLIGEEAIYPSRSELIRVAVREFLIKELETAKSYTQFQKQISKKANPISSPADFSGLSDHSDQSNPIESSETYIQIPVENQEIVIENGEKSFKTYRIIKK